MMAAVKAPSGRKIWKAVRDELMLNLYPLPFSTIAPAVFHVYLHPDDFEAIEGVSVKVVTQIQDALTAEVEKINQGLQRAPRRMIARLLDREELSPIELPTAGWEVHLRADRNGELERGQLGIVSTLAMPAPAEYAGTPTTRIVRSVVGGGRRTASAAEVSPTPQRPQPTPGEENATAAPDPPAPRPAALAATPVTRGTEHRDSRERARLTYEDDQGRHVFVMRKDSLAIGRGGSSAWVDVQIVSTSKVSREHLRLRMDADGRCYIQDVSLWGTSVDGVPIPPAVKSAEGVAQPGPEHPLPARARIGLADAVTIEFDATGAR